MPSTYAHYRFGKEVYKLLPASLREEIAYSSALYKIGLHGPDLLFYYKALYPNEISSVGFRMHEVSADIFFGGAAEVVKTRNQLAYIIGFICHFVLDSECHGYIEKYIQAKGVSHTEIEVEFDRMLMIKDGYNPVVHPLTDHIYADIGIARVIHTFFPGIEAKKLAKALRSMKFYNALLIAPNKLKRNLIYAILKITGNEKEMHGLVVNPKGNPKCRKSCERLMELYENAVPTALELIEDYMETLRNGKELNQRFYRTFGAE